MMTLVSLNSTLITNLKLSFWKQWLIHAFCIWFAITTWDALDYLHKLSLAGKDFLFNPDGSSVTIWDRIVRHEIHQRSGMIILAYTLITELNYHFVLKKERFNRFVLTSLLCGLLGVIIFLAGLWKLPNTIRSAVLPFIVCSAYAIAYAVMRAFFDKRITHSAAELSAIKAQINPHFFFNTINNIYGIALQEKAMRTAEALDQLSGLMRYVMKETPNSITGIADELKFIEGYLQIQRIRIPDKKNIRIQHQLYHDGIPAGIAPLLLIPFIENAFKYGISVDRDCFINMSVIAKDRKVQMEIVNSVFDKAPIENGEGSGIRNTQKRLALLYPGRHELTIAQTHSQYHVKLTIDL